MSERECGEYEQVNGATLNAANKRIVELEAELAEQAKVLVANVDKQLTLERWNEDLRKNKLENDQASYNQCAKLVAERDALKAKLETIEKQEPIPSHWNCGCGWHNGLDFAVCAMCLRTPAEGCATYCYRIEHVRPAIRELSYEDIEPIIGNYFGPIEYVAYDEIKRITMFASEILAKSRGEYY